MKITTIGIDLAKSVFQIHGVDGNGKPLLKKQIKRSEMATFFSNILPCLIGMEACGGTHYWARKLVDQGHTVRLMAPQFVKPYVKTKRMMPPMQRRFARRLPDPRCASYLSKTFTSKRF